MSNGTEKSGGFFSLSQDSKITLGLLVILVGGLWWLFTQLNRVGAEAASRGEARAAELMNKVEIQTARINDLTIKVELVRQEIAVSTGNRYTLVDMQNWVQRFQRDNPELKVPPAKP